MIYKTQRYQKIYVLGAGAVGCFFGGMLARAGHEVTFIARPERAEALNSLGLEMDCKAFHEMIQVKASSDLSDLRDADLVLLSVKSLDTEGTLTQVNSGIGQISYGEMDKSPGIVKLIKEITKEFLAIAAFEDVKISMSEALAANDSIATTMVTQISSTAQDLAKGKMTEINFLNGYIVELGKRYGVPTPYNQSVYALVKMMESKIK